MKIRLKDRFKFNCKSVANCNVRGPDENVIVYKKLFFSTFRNAVSMFMKLFFFFLRNVNRAQHFYLSSILYSAQFDGFMFLLCPQITALCTKRCFVNGPSTLQFSKNKILNWRLRHLYLFCDAELCDYSLKIVYTIFFSSQKAARGLNVYRVHVMHQCSSAVCHRVQACGN